MRVGVTQVVENLFEFAQLNKNACAPVPKLINPLEFWKENKNELPRLTQVDAQVLAITASSAPSERCFLQQVGSLKNAEIH